MMQIIEQTYDEKLAMYMKCTKKQLCEMLIQCNVIIDMHFPIVMIYPEGEGTQITTYVDGVFN